MTWFILLPTVLGFLAVYLLLPQVRRSRPAWAAALGGLAIVVAGLELVHGTGIWDKKDDWAEDPRAVALEHREEPGETALDGFLEDDVGLVDADLRPGDVDVVDLDGECHAVTALALARWAAGERTGRRGSRGRGCR